jgi:hypothetical protein
MIVASLAACACFALPPEPLHTVVAPDGASGDEGGRAVALSDRRLLLGMALSNAGGLSNRGAAWVFRALADGSWQPEGQLLAPDGAANDEFGFSVALDGEVAIAGAWQDDVGAKTDSGSASIFRYVNGAWSHEATLVASDGANDDEFGRSVTIRGDTALVGAWLSGLFDTGAVYVYRRQTNGTWLQTQKLAPPGIASGDQVGTTISFDGERAIVGAWGDEDGAASNTGSATVWRLTAGGTFVYEAKLIGSDVVSSDELGRGVDIDGDLAVVGSWPFFGDGVGKAYVFRRNGTTWTQEAKLVAPDGATDDYFGFSVACSRGASGDVVACGAWADDVGGTTNQGSVWTFRKNPNGWEAEDQLLADDGGASDYFGFALAMECEILTVGVRLDDVARNTNQGSARVWWLDDANANGLDDLCRNVADLDGDGTVGAADLAELLGGWGSGGQADLDGSGLIDAADLAALLANWSA